MPSPGELSIPKDQFLCAFGVTHGKGWGSHLPPPVGQPDKGSQRPTQPLSPNKAHVPLATITPCPAEGRSKALPHPLPADRGPESVAWEFV